MQPTELITTLVSFGIVGEMVAAVTQWIKSKGYLKGNSARIAAILASIVFGVAFYYLAQHESVVLTIFGVLGSATTLWATFHKKDK